MATSVVPTPMQNDPMYSPVRPGEVEAVNEPLYDFQATTTTVSGSYRFFVNPVGSGTKTYEDTNMVLSSQLSAGTAFEVRAIEVVLFPGVDPSPAATAPTASAGVAAFINDTWKIAKAGYLQFTILAKPYLTTGPVGQFPYTRRLDVAAALSDTSTAGATQMNKVAYGAMGGSQFQITPVRLLPNMNFDVQLVFPTSITISAAARLGVVLRGIRTRLSQ